MLRAKRIFLSVLILVFGAYAGSCRVRQTEEGKLPDVDVQAEGGEIPEYDVDAPDVDVKTEERRDIPSDDRIFGAISTLRERLPWANSALSAPEAMQVGDVGTVRFVVSLNKTIEALENMLLEKADIKNEKGEPQGLSTFADRVQVSHVVQASLRGEPAITVRPLGEEERVIGGGTEEWLWRVKAMEVGNQILTLSISAVIDVDGRSRKLVLKTFEREIVIRAVPSLNPVAKFLADNLTWVIGTLLLPAAIAAWRRLQAKRIAKSVTATNPGTAPDVQDRR